MTRRGGIPGFRFAADAIVPCHCGAAEGEPCRPTIHDRRHGRRLAPGAVHFGRRLKRLLLTAKAPGRREELEREVVEMLRGELKKRRRRT